MGHWAKTRLLREVTQGLRSHVRNRVTTRMGEKRIAVIGAGVIGLSSTMHLIANLEKDNIRHVVDVYASEFTPNTTSDGAAGLWEPLLCGSKTPVEQVE